MKRIVAVTKTLHLYTGAILKDWKVSVIHSLTLFNCVMLTIVSGMKIKTLHSREMLSTQRVVSGMKTLTLQMEAMLI